MQLNLADMVAEPEFRGDLDAASEVWQGQRPLIILRQLVVQ